MDRWRGGGGRLAIGAALAVGIAVAVPASNALRSAPDTGAAGDWQLVLRNADAQIVLRADLPDGHFALRYRNSVYGTLAEERFAVAGDGRLRLVDLAADQAAVLDEYYAVGEPPRPADAGDPRRWRAPPAAALSLAELALAATEHGQRTLLIDGQKPVPLWALADRSDPTLILVAEPAS
jgi:hypothetical protein